MQKLEDLDFTDDVSLLLHTVGVYAGWNLETVRYFQDVEQI